jgi:translation initiation factor 3 subunit C
MRVIEFDKLVRMIQRHHNVSEIVPAFFIKSVVNLETSINNTVQKEKEAKKKMNPSSAKALTAMKQKIKKTLKEYETAVKKYHEVSKQKRYVLF